MLWRILDMLLINFELNIPILTGPENCVISEGDTATTFVITDTKLYFILFILLFILLYQDSDVQLTGISINQKYQQKDLMNV